MKCSEFQRKWSLPRMHSLSILLFFFLVVWGWGEIESTWYVGHYLANCTSCGWWWVWSSRWKEDWQGKLRYSDRTCPSATLPTRSLNIYLWELRNTHETLQLVYPISEPRFEHGPSYLSILWTYSPCGPWPLFQFLNLYTVGRTLLTWDEPVARPLATHRTTQTQNTRTQTSMPRVGLEPTIPVFERAKTVHASDRTATAIGFKHRYSWLKHF
jgi:hypothetical protein